MAKTFFKYLKKRWWTVLIYIPAIYFSFTFALVMVMVLGVSDDGSPPLISTEWIVWIISYIVFVICMSLPMMIITVPASRELGLETGESNKKYFWIYQGIFLSWMTVLLIAPYVYMVMAL